MEGEHKKAFELAKLSRRLVWQNAHLSYLSNIHIHFTNGALVNHDTRGK